MKLREALNLTPKRYDGWLELAPRKELVKALREVYKKRERLR